MEDAEVAWIAKEFASGRMHGDIGDELGYAAAAICQHVKRFCDRWSGVDVSRQMFYGNERRRFARIALVNYTKQRTQIKRPEHHTSFHRDRQYAAALDEHVWLLRAEGESLSEIGERMGVSRARIAQRIHKFGKKMAKAMRHTRVTITHDPARDWLLVATTKDFYSV